MKKFQIKKTLIIKLLRELSKNQFLNLLHCIKISKKLEILNLKPITKYLIYYKELHKLNSIYSLIYTYIDKDFKF